MRNNLIRSQVSIMSLLCLFLLSVSSCKESKEENIEVVNPTLKLVQIPSEAQLTVESGSARIKKRGSQLYEKVDGRARLNFKDILELRKETKIKIIFPDNSYLTIGPFDHITWYTFDEK